MIKYKLACRQGHYFDSWFESSEAYDKLKQRNLVQCALCGGSDVEKAIMAPSLGSQDSQEITARAQSDKQRPNLTQPLSPEEKALRELRKQIESNAENVGKNFASEARRIHIGDAPERPIYGDATLKDAKELIEDGIKVSPLPFMKPQNS